ncbi:MAG: hypothetical protein ACOYLB_01390 [Phototrophicaceae bacterium]
MVRNQVDWYLPNHIIYMKNDGILDYPRLHGMIERIMELFSQSTAPVVYTLIDSEEVSGMPYKPTETKQFATYPVSPKVGMTIYIGKYNRIRRLAIIMFYKLVNCPVQFADSLEHALSILIQLDPQLRNLLSSLSNPSDNLLN